MTSPVRHALVALMLLLPIAGHADPVIDERLPSGIDAVNASCLFYERLFRVTLYRVEAHRSIRDLFPASRALAADLGRRFPEMTAPDGRLDELAGRYEATVEYIRSMPLAQQDRWLTTLHEPDDQPWDDLMRACPDAMQWARWVAHPERLIDPAWRRVPVVPVR